MSPIWVGIHSFHDVFWPPLTLGVSAEIRRIYVIAGNIVAKQSTARLIFSKSHVQRLVPPSTYESEPVIFAHFQPGADRQSRYAESRDVRVRQFASLFKPCKTN